tara:strand:+ start:334 stop:777 length:444 start_codon:yes stop_codon:yes gene_type:complete
MITKKKYELNKNFTHDLILGEIREKKLAEILANKPIEVKTEMGVWQEKGNLAIEIEFDGEPSGLYKTHSEYWWHNLEVRNEAYMSLFFKVDILKAIVKKIEDKYPHRIVMGGDDNLSKLVLVPLAGLFFLKEKDLNWREAPANKKGE